MVRERNREQREVGISLRRALVMVEAGLAQDVTAYCRSLGYCDERPVIVMDGRVITLRNRDFVTFCHQLRMARAPY